MDAAVGCSSSAGRSCNGAGCDATAHGNGTQGSQHRKHAATQGAAAGPAAQQLRQSPAATNGASQAASLARSLSFVTQPFEPPPYSDSQELKDCMSQLLSWTDFNVFDAHELSGGRSLYEVAKAALEAEGLLDGWRLDRATTLNYLAAVQASYLPGNPYHNAMHAADVTQAVAVMLRSAAAQGLRLTQVERFSVLLAAAVHDLAHPGVTNEFLAVTNAPSAITYNDRSSNENRHASCAFRLARAGPGLDVFAGLQESEYREVRRLLVGCVLTTDMVRHYELLEAFAAMRRGQPDINAWPRRDLLLQLVLHAADISNPLRPLSLATRWGELVVREFVAQGDRERALGLPVTPACDSETLVVSTSQLRFAKLFVKPLMEEFRHVSSEFSDLALSLQAKVNHYWSRHEALLPPGPAHPLQRLPPEHDSVALAPLPLLPS